MEKPGSRYNRRYCYPSPSFSIEESALAVINNTGVVTRNLLKRMRDTSRYRGQKWNCITYDWTDYNQWRQLMYLDMYYDEHGIRDRGTAKY